MIVDSKGHKLTPTKVAKEALEYHAYMAVEMPAIEHIVEVDKLSEGDKKKIGDAIRKQYDRVRKLMGMDPL